MFQSYVGVRQGENLSPLLFSIFLNDFEQFLLRKSNGLRFTSDLIYNHLQDEDTVIYLKLITLLYADDTIIFAETPDDLQKSLEALNDYCNQWDLKVNASKTKIIIFSRGKVKKLPVFYLNDVIIDIVDDYKYLGIIFQYNGKFSRAQKHLYDQASKAMFSLIAKSRKFSLPIDLQLELFDSLVRPILTYGCEIWGFENILGEKLHLKYCKMILKCKSCTTSCMVLGELGRSPIKNHVNLRMVNFWSYIINKNGSSYVKTLYNLILNLSNDDGNIFSSDWITHIKGILFNCGFNFVWNCQQVNSTWLKNCIKQRISDQQIQDWSSTLDNSSSCYNYKIFKSELCLEKYLIILPRSLSIPLTKFRLRNSKIPVVSGTFFNIDYDDRICKLCNANLIGDEFHYLFECNHFDNARKKFLDNYFFSNPNTIKMNHLFNSTDKQILISLSKFISLILDKFQLS